MGGRQEGSKAAYKKYVRTSPPAPIVYETRFELTGGLRRKSTVYGLNGHRAHCVIFLSVVTYEHTLQKSRRFTALFSWTLFPEASYPSFEIDAEKSAHTPHNS